MAVSVSPRFEVTPVSLDALQPDRVGPGTVVVINGVAPSRGVERLRAALDRGAGLLVVAGEGEWGRDAVAVLPGTLGELVDRSRGGAGLVTGIEASHPAVASLRGLRGSGFSSARVFQYRRLAPAVDATVIARFDDGNVALAERTVGRGRVVVWTSSFDTLWNDVALRPVFVPLVHGLLRYLSNVEDTPSAYTVGQVVEPAVIGRGRGGPDQSRSGRLAIRTPAGAPATGAADDALALVEPGFYEIRSGDRTLSLAVNVDRVESDLTRLVPEELAAAVAGDPSARAAATGPVTAEDEERRSGIWWYLLLAALALLAVETVLANRIAGRRVPAG
jgi:hypothetical protein